MNKQTQRTSKSSKSAKGGFKVLMQGKAIGVVGSRQATRRLITRTYNLKRGGKGRKAERLVQVPRKFREACKVVVLH